MPTLPPAVTPTDQRLDAILAELQALRADLDRAPVAVRQRLDHLTATLASVADGEPVELREPETPAKPKPKAKR